MIPTASIRILGFLVALTACRPGPILRQSQLRQPNIKGAAVAHVHHSAKGYGSGAARATYEHLKKIGYNAVQLNSFAYQKSIADIKLHYDDPTLSDDRILQEIKLLHSMSFEVLLKPHIWLSQSARPKVWRSGIDYDDEADVDRWFAEYYRYISKQVQIAILGKVEYFAVGTELRRLTRHTAHWRNLIKKVRGLGYKGKLTYACEAWNARNIEFWPDLDFIGLDFYYGLKDKNPSEANLIEFYKAKLMAHYAHAHEIGRSLMLTEIGFPAHLRAFSKPSAWPQPGYEPRPDLQQAAYRAFRLALNEVGYPEAVWLWKYVTTLDSYERQVYPTGFILEGKPAMSLSFDNETPGIKSLRT